MSKMKKYRELVELKGLMRQKKINYVSLSNKLEISLSSLSDKINGFSVFNLEETIRITDILKIKKEDICKYFF